MRKTFCGNGGSRHLLKCNNPGCQQIFFFIGLPIGAKVQIDRSIKYKEIIPSKRENFLGNGVSFKVSKICFKTQLQSTSDILVVSPSVVVQK